MMPPQTKLANFILFARFLVFLDLCFIAIGSRFGRYFERNFADYIFLIPYVGLFAVVATFAIFLRYMPECNFKLIAARLKKTSSILTLVGIVLVIAASEYFNEMPIERIHLVKYTSLTFLLRFCFSKETNANRAIAISAITSLLIGVTEEILQIWMPGRIFDPKDLLLNLLAVALGTLLLHFSNLIFQTKIST